MTRVELHVKVSPGRVNVEQARLEEFVNNPAGGVVRDLVRRGNNVEAAARPNVPVDTGTLAATLRTQVDFSGRLPAVDIIVGRAGLTEYTGYVIGGTRPHEIRPRAAKALRFISSGQVVFAARAQHPGTRPHPFMQEALEAARN